MSDPKEELISRVTEIIVHEMKDRDIGAIGIILVKGQSIYWTGTIGHENDEKKPISGDTIWRIGSVSKLFTDIAIMQLVESGDVDLNDPVSKHIPSFKPKNPFNTEITIRHLTMHRSGLQRESPIGNFYQISKPPLKDIVASLNETEILFEPGSKVKYSNAALAVLGYIVEAVKNKPFSQYMQDSLLKPMQMKLSSFDKPKTPYCEACIWGYDSRKVKAPTHEVGNAPAGCMYATLNDLASFISVLLNNGTVQSTGEKILKKETLEQMYTPQGPTNGPKFGIGFRITDLEGGSTMYHHGGSISGFASTLRYIPAENIGVVVITNKDLLNGLINGIADFALFNLRSMDNPQLQKPIYRPFVDIDSELSNKLKGLFVGENGQEVEIRLRKGASLGVHIDCKRDKLFLMDHEGIREIRSYQDKPSDLVVDDMMNWRGRPILLKYSEDYNEIKVDDASYKRKEVPKGPPPPPPEKWLPLIGEYGFDHFVFNILEQNGKLFVMACWLVYFQLTPTDDENVYLFPTDPWSLYYYEKLYIKWDETKTKVLGISIGCAYLERRLKELDNPGEPFRVKVVKPIAETLENAKTLEPPKTFTKEPIYKSDFVDLKSLDPNIKYDVQYGTDHNVLGFPMYPSSEKAFMQRPAAEALSRASKKLASEGYGVIIYDTYRPWYVTKTFWEVLPDELKIFVADPSNGSVHNRGCAVDLSLLDLSTGKVVDMGAGYDETSDRSFADYLGGTSRQRYFRQVLRNTMEEEGFSINQFEWWHFDYKDGAHYPVCNSKLEDL